MRNLNLMLALLVACGDNIHPATPDAFDLSDVTPDHQTKPDDAPTQYTDAGVDASDAGAPDASACEDSHIELNGHEHKCRHARP